MERACAQCDRLFLPCPTTPEQKFCGADCRRAKRREVQKERLAIDLDYRENQQRAQQAWRERNPDYMREYRKRRPGYVKRNRLQQGERNRRRQQVIETSPPDEPTPMIVKMIELDVDPILVPGPYRFVFEKGVLIVKMDEFLPHPIRLSGVSLSSAPGGS